MPSVNEAAAGGLLIALLALLACAGAPAPVPLYGDAARLAGNWRGQYTSTESGRSGSIAFRLEMGRDTARGDVLMFVPRAPGEAPRFEPAGARPAPVPPDARPLSIRFVQVEEDRVRGILDPYPDPGCGCTVETVFVGRLAGDIINGTFTTRRLDRDQLQHGVWRVRRD